MKTGSEVFIGCLLLIALFFVAMATAAFIFMIAWNAFIPLVFNGPIISYPVALAGWLLLGIIGGSFRSSVTTKS